VILSSALNRIPKKEFRQQKGARRDNRVRAFREDKDREHLKPLERT
jgi:hypothetical protein